MLEFSHHRGIRFYASQNEESIKNIQLHCFEAVGPKASSIGLRFITTSSNANASVSDQIEWCADILSETALDDDGLLIFVSGGMLCGVGVKLSEYYNYRKAVIMMNGDDNLYSLKGIVDKVIVPSLRDDSTAKRLEQIGFMRSQFMERPFDYDIFDWEKADGYVFPTKRLNCLPRLAHSTVRCL